MSDTEPAQEQQQKRKEQKWQEPPPPPPEGMTKSAWKRQLRRQKTEERREMFAERRKEKKKELKQKRKEQRQRGENVAPTRRKPPADQIQTGVNILIDCAFDDLMTDNELVSLASQLNRSYGENHKAEKQAQLKVTSFNKRLKERYETVMHRQHDYWKGIEFSEEEYTPDPATMVYLSSDSPNTIENLEPGKTYIVGGIVDKNRYKNLCNDKAQAQSIPTGRLPIGDYFRVSGRKVLTTNHVVEILLQYLQHKDWKQAFEHVIPQRKHDKDEEE